MTYLHPGVNFVTHSDIEIVEAGADRAVGRIVIAPHHHQPYGVVHGGVYCTLVETLASTGAAMWAMDQGLMGCVGVHNSTDFVRSTREGTLVGVASPVHRGRSQQLWLVEITREEDAKLLARGQVRLHNLTDDAAIS
ncbi:MAG TPA: PaaI family thioesterase [Acidimicrobiia bacterium]|nr:PaaI family thioesterase [Acidimicrobiia bacterium]